MKKAKIITLILAGLVAVGFMATLPLVAEAQVRNPCSLMRSACDDQPTSATSIVNTIIDVLLWVVGIVAVIFIIIGGIRYAASGGSPEQIKAAKNTILYSVIGLVAAILAYAVVRMIVRLNWS